LRPRTPTHRVPFVSFLAALRPLFYRHFDCTSGRITAKRLCNMHRGGHRGRGRGGGNVRPKAAESQEKSTETKSDIKPDETKPKPEAAAPKTVPDRKHAPFHGPPAGHDHTNMSRIPQQMAFTARVTLHMWIPAEEVDIAQRQARLPVNSVQFLALVWRRSLCTHTSASYDCNNICRQGRAPRHLPTGNPFSCLEKLTLCLC
jgi:hypothetical protein